MLRNELVEEVLEMKYAYLLYLQSYKQRTKKVSLGRTLSFFSGQGIRKSVLHFFVCPFIIQNSYATGANVIFFRINDQLYNAALRISPQ